MPKKVKKKLHIKILPVIIILLVLIVIFFTFMYISKLPIKTIYISGNYYLTDQEIIETAKIDNYPSFIKTTSHQINKNLKKNTLIDEVTITKKWWGIIKIKIKEHNILFREYNNDNKVVLSNKKNMEDNLNRYQAPRLLNYVPDTKYEDFIKGMNKITNDIKTQISEITYLPNDQDKDRFLLYMNDGNYVYLTLTKFKQLNYYEEVLKKLKGKKGVLYLDSGNHFQIMEE